MAIYMDGKHDSDKTETSISKKTYTVSLTFVSQSAKNPLEAAKNMVKTILEDGGLNSYIFDVIDEDTEEKFTVDLDEEDEDAVLPNNE